MAFGHLKLPLRVVAVATVACGLALTACSSVDKSRDHVKIDPKALRAPAYNPQLVNGQVQLPTNSRTPEGNAGMGTGSAYNLKTDAQSVADPVEQEIAAYEAEKRQNTTSSNASDGFQWPWEDRAPSLADTPRKTPALNSEGVNGDVALAPATYGASPTGEVVISNVDSFVPAEMGASASPQGGEYPSLSTVPQRPDRLQAVNERGEKFAELDAEYRASGAAAQQLNSQMAYDANVAGGLEAQPQLAQPVGAHSASAQVVASAPTPVDNRSLAHLVKTSGIHNPDYSAQAGGVVQNGAVVPANEVAGAAPVATYQPPLEAAYAAPQQPASAPVVMGSAPAPLVAPQTSMAAVTSADVVPVQEGEWVDLSQGAQGSVPVEEVAVNTVPVVNSVPIAPEAVAASASYGYGGGYGMERNRVLPESRYAARRQALYAEQQSRRQTNGRPNFN